MWGLEFGVEVLGGGLGCGDWDWDWDWGGLGSRVWDLKVGIQDLVFEFLGLGFRV